MVGGRSTRERKLAVCTGSAHLPPAEFAELLTVLAEDPDEAIRERAVNALLATPVESFVAALQTEMPAKQLFRYCGNNLTQHPAIAAGLMRHPRSPMAFLLAAAKHLSVSTVQELMDDLERLCSSPSLVAAMLHSAPLNGDQRQQIQDLMREDTEQEEAFAEAAAEAESDPAKRVTLLQRLSHMRVVERVSLALKGNREERIALIRDPCKVVQRAVLQSARITDKEVEMFASMASLTDEVLRLIGTNRKFRRNYNVIRNLIVNPKTPLDLTLHLLPSVNPQDLKSLSMNRNVPETLRSAATRLQRQRTVNRGGEE